MIPAREREGKSKETYGGARSLGVGLAGRALEHVTAKDTIGRKGQVIDDVGTAKGAVGTAVLDELVDATLGLITADGTVAGAAVADGDNGGVFALVDAVVLLHQETVGEHELVDHVLAGVESIVGPVATGQYSVSVTSMRGLPVGSRPTHDQPSRSCSAPGHRRDGRGGF